MSRYAEGGSVQPVSPSDSIPAVLSEGMTWCGHDDCDWEMEGGTIAEQGRALLKHTRTAHGSGR